MTAEHRLALAVSGAPHRFEVRLEGLPVFTVEWSERPKIFDTLTLTPTSREAGARLMEALARAFEVPALPSATQAPLAPVKVRFTTLSRRDGLAMTKWFLDVDGREGELFFNVDLARGTAELLEKAPEDSLVALAAVARLVRDGVPSNADDPRFSTAPPLGASRALEFEGRVVLQQVFADRAIFSAPTELLSVDLSTGAISELTPVTAPFRAKWCAEATCWLVTEPGSSFLLVDDRREPLTVPSGCEPSTLSPDRAWVALARWHDCTTRRGRFSEVVLLHRASGRELSARDGERSFHVKAWHARGLVLAVFEGLERHPSQHVLLDFETGSCSTAAAPPPPPACVRLEGERVILSNGKSVTLTASEQEDLRVDHFTALSPTLVKWNRFGKPVLIGLERGELFSLGEDVTLASFAPGGKHVVLHRAGRWSIADVVI